MAKPRKTFHELQGAGHLEGASDSLLADLSDLLVKENEDSRLEQIRGAMMLALKSTPGVHFFADQVQAAVDLQALWRLRDELLVLVSEHNEAHHADQILQSITAMFLGASMELSKSATKPAAKKKTGSSRPR